MMLISHIISHFLSAIFSPCSAMPLPCWKEPDIVLQALDRCNRLAADGEWQFLFVSYCCLLLPVPSSMQWTGFVSLPAPWKGKYDSGETNLHKSDRPRIPAMHLRNRIVYYIGKRYASIRRSHYGQQLWHMVGRDGVHRI